LARFVINAKDVVSAAERLAAATREPFECRHSDYLGKYCIFQAFLDAVDVSIISNADPMYRPGDPAEDKVFESQFGPDKLLINVEREVGSDAIDVIRKVFPDAVLIERHVSA